MSSPESSALVITVETVPEITINEVLPPDDETAQSKEAGKLTEQILYEMMQRFWRD